MEFNCGQSPGEGDYLCIKCGEIYQIKNFDILIPCSHCKCCVFENEIFPFSDT